MRPGLVPVFFLFLLSFAGSCFLPCALADGPGENFVEDRQGVPLPGARVEIRTGTGLLLHEITVGEGGDFSLPALPSGRYRLIAKAKHFTDAEIPYSPDPPEPLRIRLALAAIHSTVTVAAERGSVGDSRQTAQMTSTRPGSASLPAADPGQLLSGAPGIMIQQSAPGQVSPFLRGLTGYHVLNLIDGIRFNNATFRAGPNQYLAWIDPGQLEAVEAVQGPSGVEYGSDALGGAIYLRTPPPPYAPKRIALHGDLFLQGATADLSAGSAMKWAILGEKFSWQSGLSGRHYNDVRAGQGQDSHHVFQRFLGLPPGEIRKLTGARLSETAYSRQGAFSKLAFRLPGEQQIQLWYQGSTLKGVRGYKDLMGGLGRLQSFFVPQSLQFGYARYEKLALGPLDSVSGTISVNSQRDGSVRQGLRWEDTRTAERNRVLATGLSSQATSHIGSRQSLVFGLEHYREKVAAAREEQTLSLVRAVRPLYPDGSRYRTSGFFLQDMVEPVRNKVRWTGGLRYTRISWGSGADPRFGIPSSASRFRDLSFQTALSAQIHHGLAVHFLSGKGFRAPNLNDLGAIGLNDLGYEIPASEAAGAMMGTSAGETALSLGKPVRALVPESMVNFESGITLTGHRTHLRIQAFQASLHHPIVRRTLVFAAGSYPSSLAGMEVQPIAPTPAQAAQGIVTVSPLFDPRAIKAFVNEGRARYRGVESRFDWTLTPQWAIHASYSFLSGKDLDPERPVRRLPPQSGRLSLQRQQSRFWGELRLLFAGRQRLLSGGDLDDERIGASRSRSDIAAFYRGARMAEWVDGQGRFRPTGETLLEIQNRLLPLGTSVNGVYLGSDSTRAPLFTATPSWWTLDVETGFRLSESSRLGLGVTNLTDRNFRIHGSGVDSPGRSVYLSFYYGF